MRLVIVKVPLVAGFLSVFACVCSSKHPFVKLNIRENPFLDLTKVTDLQKNWNCPSPSNGSSSWDVFSQHLETKQEQMEGGNVCFCANSKLTKWALDPNGISSRNIVLYLEFFPWLLTIEVSKKIFSKWIKQPKKVPAQQNSDPQMLESSQGQF